MQSYRLILTCIGLALLFFLTTRCGPARHIEGERAENLAVFDEPTDFDNPTYSKTIAPILNKRCNICHQTGGMAPFSLETFSAVHAFSKGIREEVANRTMPPPGIDNSGQCQKFTNAHWLPQEELNAITNWIDNGMPKGVASAQLPRPQQPGLPDPKLILKMPKPYTPNPPEGRSDDYRCFLIDPKQSEDTLVTAIEILPDQIQQVHHVIVFKPTSVDSQAEAEKMDGADGFPGYPCFGSGGVPSTILGMWAPGGNADELRDTESGAILGKRLEKGRKVIMQVHYNVGHAHEETESPIQRHPGHPHPDQSSIAIKFNKSALPVKWLVLANIWLSLDAGKTDIASDDEQGNSWLQMQSIIYERGLADEYVHGGGILSLLSKELVALLLNPPDAKEFKIYSVAPHMHTTGFDIKVDKISSGKEECMAHVPQFDFHWQGSSNYTTPIRVAKSDRFKITCHFNTTGRTETTKFGEGTEDEMCLAFLLVAE